MDGSEDAGTAGPGHLEAPAASNSVSPNLDRVLRYLPFITIAHLVVGMPTLIVSLALAYFAFVQADATKKMQTGGAMPFVTFGTSNSDDATHAKEISLSLSNNGVGPAILGPIEIRYQGKAATNPPELLRMCCERAYSKGVSLTTSPSTGVAIRPGEDLRFLRLPDSGENAKLWAVFNNERWKLKVRACYCSIFGDCWVTEGMQGVPKPVKQCPTNWVPYQEKAEDRFPK